MLYQILSFTTHTTMILTLATSKCKTILHIKSQLSCSYFIYLFQILYIYISQTCIECVYNKLVHKVVRSNLFRF